MVGHPWKNIAQRQLRFRGSPVPPLFVRKRPDVALDGMFLAVDTADSMEISDCITGRWMKMDEDG